MTATASPNRNDRLLAVLLLLTVWISFGYFQHGANWGANSFLDLTRGIVERGTFAIDATMSNTGDYARIGEHTFINKNPGTSFVAVPAYFIVHLLAPDSFATFVGMQRAVHLTTFFSISLLAALAVALLYLGLRRVYGPGASLLGALTLAVGGMYFHHAAMLNAEVIVAACYVIAGYALLRMHEADERGGAAIGCGLLAGAALGFAVVTVPTSIFVVALFFGAMGLARYKRTSFAIVVVGALPAALLLAIYNLNVLGTLFGTVYAYQNPMYRNDDAFLGVFGWPSPKVLFYLTFHPARGLFWLSPVLLAALPGWYLMLRERSTRLPGGLALAVVGVYLLFNMSFLAWAAGWGIGPRYLLPALPFFAAATAAAADRNRAWRIVIVALLAVSVAVTLAVALVNPQPPPIKTVTNQLTQYIWPLLKAGYVSVNQLHFGQLFPDQPPSTAFEKMWAAYNLGELLGYRKLASILPLSALWLATGLLGWRLWRRVENQPEIIPS